MKDIIGNIERKNIKNIVAYFNNVQICKEFIKSVQEVNFKKLIIVYEFSKKEMEIIKNEIKSNNIQFYTKDKFNPLNGNWTLVAYCVDGEKLLDFAKYKPSNLMAELADGLVNSFRLWENFKDISDTIFIVSYKNGRKNILDWHRESKIEISVVLPTYNVANYLDQCIESLIKWKANYIEFIFVNDGSTDNSREIINKWSRIDDRIRIIDKENGGCASARQEGIRQARGNYIGFIDPDDYIDPRMYFSLFSSALEGSYEIAYCGYNELYNDTGKVKKISDAFSLPYCVGTSDVNLIRKLIMYSNVAIWRGIYKKALINRAGIHFYEDLKRFDDLPFKVEIFANAKSVIAVNENLYYYRLARPGQDVSTNDERLYVHFDIFKHLDESIGKMKNQRLNDYLQIVRYNTHKFGYDKIKSNLKKEYLERAINDLNINCSNERTKKLVSLYLGKSELFY